MNCYGKLSDKSMGTSYLGEVGVKLIVASAY